MSSHAPLRGNPMTFMEKPSTPLNKRNHQNLNDSTSVFSKTWNLITASFSAGPVQKSVGGEEEESSGAVSGKSGSEIQKAKKPHAQSNEENKENLGGANEEGKSTLPEVSDSIKQESSHKPALSTSACNDSLPHEAENAAKKSKGKTRLVVASIRSSPPRDTEDEFVGDAFLGYPDAGDDNSVGSSQKQLVAQPRCAMEYMNMIREEEGGHRDPLPFQLPAQHSTTSSNNDIYGGTPIIRESSERISSTFLEKVNQRILKIKTDQAKERMALINGAPCCSTSSRTTNHADANANKPLQYSVSKNPTVLRLQGISPAKVGNTPAPPAVHKVQATSIVTEAQPLPSPERSRGCRPARSREVCYPLNPEFTSEESSDARRRAVSHKRALQTTAQESCLKKLLSLQTAQGITSYSLQCAWEKAEDIFRNYIIPLDNNERNPDHAHYQENIDDRAAVNVMRLMGIPPNIRNTIYWEVLEEMQILQEFSVGTIGAIGSVIEWICTGNSVKSGQILSQARYVATAQTEVDPDSETWRQFESDLSIFTDAVVTNVGNIARAVSRQCVESSEQVVTRLSSAATSAWNDNRSSSMRFHGGPQRNFRSNLTRTRIAPSSDASESRGTTRKNIAGTPINQYPSWPPSVSMLTPGSAGTEAGIDDTSRESSAWTFTIPSRTPYGRADACETPVNTSVIAGMVSASEFDLQSSPSTSFVESRPPSRGATPTPSKSRIPVRVTSSTRSLRAIPSLVKIAESVASKVDNSPRETCNNNPESDPHPRNANGGTVKDMPPQTPSVEASSVNDVPSRTPSVKGIAVKDSSRALSVNAGPLKDLPPRSPSVIAGSLNNTLLQPPSVNWEEIRSEEGISKRLSKLQLQPERTDSVIFVPQVQRKSIASMPSSPDQELFSTCKRLTSEPLKKNSNPAVSKVIRTESRQLFASRNTYPHNSSTSVRSTPTVSNGSNGNKRSIQVSGTQNNGNFSIPGTVSKTSLNPQTTFIISAASKSGEQTESEMDVDIHVSGRRRNKEQNIGSSASEALKAMELQYADNPAWQLFQYIKNQDSGVVLHPESDQTVKSATTETSQQSAHPSSVASGNSKSTLSELAETLITPSSGTSVSNGNRPLGASGSTIGTQNSMYYETSSGRAYFLNPDRTEPVPMAPPLTMRRSKLSSLTRASVATTLPNVPASSELELDMAIAKNRAKKDIVHLNNSIHSVIKKKIPIEDKRNCRMIPTLTSQQRVQQRPPTTRSSPATPMTGGSQGSRPKRASVSVTESRTGRGTETSQNPILRRQISLVQSGVASATPAVQILNKRTASKNSYLEKSKMRNQLRQQSLPTSPRSILSTSSSTPVRIIAGGAQEAPDTLPGGGRSMNSSPHASVASRNPFPRLCYSTGSPFNHAETPASATVHSSISSESITPAGIQKPS